MAPLEKLNAAAARLIQEAEAAHGKQEHRLKEIASTIRGAVATIRTALDCTERRPQHPKFPLIAGDENADFSPSQNPNR